ncbi:hypothetical protein [Actinomadura algeriensis]|uniref:Uncharacterized protein n=1 Tax=Actinomadura algeriensis TaxID=1679523 RepID=A0ABR9JN33_9ACTN|nr:hypothetical protein [Actinomadura algeriensis]MBE1531839.1 hypothetical protein [Actinomadura algeriensis]
MDVGGPGAAAVTGIPAFAAGLCDDAAVFPPGRAPLAAAVPAHRRHRAAPYARAVGPLVLPATALDDLAPLLAAGPDGPLDLAITAPAGPAQAAGALAAAADLPVDLRGLEVAVPSGQTADELIRAVDGLRTDVPVHVEVPRDERRPAIVAALAASGHRAKFRTGGVTADLYPDPDELAAAIALVVGAGVPFKATAGLHHPVRNTDPETGFDQHGFLNLLLAADAALGGRPAADLAALLAERDAASVAARVAALPPGRTAAARAAFGSFGTCSITDPLTELADLGLLPAALTEEYA